MDSSFDELIDRAMYLGVHQVAYPIDILGTARLLAEHASDDADFERILSLVSDPENHFTRWVAIRAIVILGPASVAKARETLSVRMTLEGFPLARQELHNALASTTE
ncbi:hypothetical protein LOY28_17700 [Pseudomonas sp. B21-017]|jgi:hypothetical protein|uniref:HEAT repeat domain-containing protein n=1 Tax=Pseudomonas frederiksbergensis TaxID=104087 RepID=A0AB33EAC6_9PSED|nr:MULTISPECIES: hypothetical protein [Pseudomonas]ATE77228.1 hypothetical protein CNN82_12660 [Pseudomonas frederiksbergensis]UVM36556.1 hypothetical protein LOY28_17700 [Pseudomonas sp. B21-017]